MGELILLNWMLIRKRDLAKVTEGFREGEVTAETGVTPDRVVVLLLSRIGKRPRKMFGLKFFYWLRAGPHEP